MAAPEQNQQQYLGIQALRFVAAFFVLIAHTTFGVSERIDPDYFTWHNGAMGVYMFFIISGFVMMVSSQKLMGQVNGWKIFLKRRLIRIVPMYWLVTTIKLLVVLLIPAVALHSSFEIWHTLASYFFIPARNVEGLIRPIHAVGWTLTYEMFFYLVFATMLFLRRPPLPYMLVFFCILASINYMIQSDEGYPAIVLYSRPLILYFLMGMLLGQLCLKGFRPPVWLSVTMLIIGFVVLFMQPHIETELIWPDFYRWAPPSAFIVSAVAFLEPQLKKFMSKPLLLLGDSSYSLYLFHPIMVPAIAVLLAKSGFIDPNIAVVLILILMITVCLGIYLILEKPLTDYLKNHLR